MELATKAPSWLGKVLLPQLNAMRGDIRALDAKFTGRIDGLEGKLNGRFDLLGSKLTGRIDGLSSKMDAEFGTVHSEIKRLDQLIEGIDKRMDLTERLVAVEAKVRDLEAKR